MFLRDITSCFGEAPTFNAVEWLLLLRPLESLKLLEPDVRVDLVVLQFLISLQWDIDQ